LAKPLDEADVQRLAAALRGDLIRPADDRYDAARAVFNAMVDRRPALIVRCAGVADVVRGVEFARSHDVPLGTRRCSSWAYPRRPPPSSSGAW
jgi:hypothetical protein